MSFFGGGKSSTPSMTTVTQNRDPWSGQQPFLTTGFERAKTYLDQPIQYYPNSTVVPFAPQTEEALGAQETRARAGSPILGAGSEQMLKTIRGDYLSGGNPYLEGQINRASRPLVENYLQAVSPGLDARFSKAGRYGSGMHALSQQGAQEGLGRALGDVAGSMAYQNYLAERNAQQAATMGAPAYAQADYADIGQLREAGSAREAKAGAELQDAINRYMAGQTAPQDALSRYMALVAGGQYGGSTAETRSEPIYTNPLAGLLGTGATLAGIGGTMFGRQGIWPPGQRPWGYEATMAYLDDLRAARQQSLWQGLLGAGAGLLGAAGPSRQPLGWGPALGAGAQGFMAGQQGYMQNAYTQLLRDMQMETLERARKKEQTQEQARRALALGGSPLDASRESLLMEAYPDAYGKGVVEEALSPAALKRKAAETEIEEGIKAKYRAPFDPIFQDLPLAGDKIQRQVSYDNGRTWHKRGEPYDRREPLVFQTGVDEHGNVVTMAYPRAGIAERLAGAGGTEAKAGFPQPPGQAPGQVAKQPSGSVPSVVVATKPPKFTDSQATSALYADRMAKAEEILREVEGQGATFWGRLRESVPGGNYLQSREYQRFEQARRDFINAVLRRESGAVISDAEFANADRQYFPVPGDLPAVIAQKRRDRQTALEGIRRAAGPAYKSAIPPPPAGAVVDEE